MYYLLVVIEKTSISFAIVVNVLVIVAIVKIFN